MENPEEFTCQLIQKGVAQDLNGNNQGELFGFFSAKN